MRPKKVNYAIQLIILSVICLMPLNIFWGENRGQKNLPSVSGDYVKKEEILESMVTQEQDKISSEQTEIIEMVKLVEIISDPFSDKYPENKYQKPFQSLTEYSGSIEQKKFVPQAGLDDACAYGDEMFFELVLHPKQIEVYGAVLTESSVEAWKKFPWIYANPQDYYDSSFSYMDRGEDEEGYIMYISKIYLSDRDTEADRTLAGGIDKEYLEQIIKNTEKCDIGIQVYWEYEKATGKVQITKMYYRDLTEEREKELIEEISNPKLKVYWPEYERPFVSYADSFGLDKQVFEYLPVPGLDRNAQFGEDAEWENEMFFDLVLHPEKVEEYGTILTESSVEAWKKFQWIYANPEAYYKEVYSYVYIACGDYVICNTNVKIPAEYFYTDNIEKLENLDRTLAEGVDQELLDSIWMYNASHNDIAIDITWEYEKKTGLVQVVKLDYYYLSSNP